MASIFEATVVPGGESARQFDAVYDYVRNMAQARCAAVIVINDEWRSGYSVLDSLQKMAVTLRGQLAKNLQ